MIIERHLKSVISLLTITLSWQASQCGAQSPSRSDRPNIVIILADDLGYGDVQSYNPVHGRIPTPNIDRLAAQGMRFTDAHSASGVCSPSRYTLLTGRYHWRTRLQRGIVGVFEKPLIDADRLTIAGLLKNAGYQTACIGKWHLGWDWNIPEDQRHFFNPGSDPEKLVVTPEHLQAWQNTFQQEIQGGPTTRGFDIYFGTDVPNWPPFCFIDNNRTVGVPTEFLPESYFAKNQASVRGPALKDWTLKPILPTLGDRAVQTVTEFVKEDAPFFLYMPLTAPHTPLAVNPEWDGKSRLNAYADFVMETDSVVGRVVAAIDQAGIRDKTLIIFTSDNGCAPYIGFDDLVSLGHHPSGPLRGYKSDVWEGGHRVPFITSWPGVINEGTTCDQTVGQVDLMATCAELAAIAIPEGAAGDSVSLAPLLRNSSPAPNAWTRPPLIQQSIQGMFAIRDGQLKLILGQGSGGWSKSGSGDAPGQLYDLSSDLGESKNLYDSRPEEVQRIWKSLVEIVDNGRSTPGPQLSNDVPVNCPRPE